MDATAKVIRLRTTFPDREPPQLTDVVFTDVVGFHFNGDPFYTILFDIYEVPVESIYIEEREKFVAGRMYGWPGHWNRSDESVLDYVVANEIKGFAIASAIGLSGWVLAKGMQVVGPTASNRDATQ